MINSLVGPGINTVEQRSLLFNICGRAVIVANMSD